jgi:hypothetical protein
MLRAVLTINSKDLLLSTWEIASFQHIGWRKRVREWISVFMECNHWLKTALACCQNPMSSSLSSWRWAIAHAHQMNSSMQPASDASQVLRFSMASTSGFVVLISCESPVKNSKLCNIILITSAVTGKRLFLFFWASGQIQICERGLLIKLFG